jgi:glutathione S-transferase
MKLSRFGLAALPAGRATSRREGPMAEYVLHCFAESGNAYKAALMLELCGCAWKPRPVAYFSGETKSDDFRAVNEQGEVPVLEHQGRRLSQSGVILIYLAETTGQFRWKNEEERLEVLRWILYDNHKFTSYFATLRFLFGLQKSGETPVTEFLRARVVNAFGTVDKHLASRPFIIGDEPTIADLSMGRVHVLPGRDRHRSCGIPSSGDLGSPHRGPFRLEASL